MKENKITINNLIYALLFLVFGIILLTNEQDIVEIASKVVGVVLIIVGIVKSIVYIYMKGKLGEYSFSELAIGLVLISIGTLFILYSSALSFAIRLIIGFWTLVAGINKIILAISVKSIDRTGFRMYLSTSIIMILVGISLISGLFDRIVGLLIIIYAVTEIVDYIYFRSKSKNYETVVDKEPKSKKKTKRLKDKKVVDAIIEEDSDKK